jgi:hypothetical protein
MLQRRPSPKLTAVLSGWSRIASIGFDKAMAVAEIEPANGGELAHLCRRVIARRAQRGDGKICCDCSYIAKKFISLTNCDCVGNRRAEVGLWQIQRDN